MINNYVEYQYQASHLIHSFDLLNKLNIYLGDVSSALDLNFIHASNIKTVVTAAASMDQVTYKPQDNIKHIVYSVLDHKNQNLIKYFDQFFQLVQKQIKQGSILVHCAAGISRSATLVISYLMKKFNWTFKQAIKYVRNSRPTVLPNLGFQRQLKQYQKVIIQQQNRRLKSKTSQSNKHVQNKPDLLPQIGIMGLNNTKNKILQAFRIYKRDEEFQKAYKRNIFVNNQMKNDQRLNSLKIQNIQKFKPVSRQFGQTKSVSLQQGVERINNRQYEQNGKVINSYLQMKTDNNEVVSSRKQLASRNGLFDSAIIPIKYNTVNKGMDKLKKTNIKFTQLNTNNITINRINIFKQKYSRSNAPLSLGKAQLLDHHQFQQPITTPNTINQPNNNLIQLKTKQNFSIKLSKMKQSSSQFNQFNNKNEMNNKYEANNRNETVNNRNNLVLDRNISQIPILNKNIWPQTKKQSQKKNRQQLIMVGDQIINNYNKKVNIKNMLFSQT